MLFGSIIAARHPLAIASTGISQRYLKNALKANDPYIALILCHDAEVSLSQAARGSKRFEIQGVHEGIATAYVSLGRLLDHRGRRSEAQACYKKAEKIG